MFMLGYYKGYPEEYLDRNGYFRTGDSGHLDEDGVLHWGRPADRHDQDGRRQRVAGRDRVEALAVGTPQGGHRRGRAQHPLLDEAVVVCAACHDDDPVSSEEILGHLKSVLASYKVPKRVVFVGEDELPNTATEEGWSSPMPAASPRWYIAVEDSDWARHLRGVHADLLAEPAGTAS